MKNHIASALIAMSLVAGLSVASGKDSDVKYMTQEEAYDKGWFSPVEATMTLGHGDYVVFKINDSHVEVESNHWIEKDELLTDEPQLTEQPQLLDRIMKNNFSGRDTHWKYSHGPSLQNSSILNDSFTDLVYGNSETNEYRRIRCEIEGTRSGEMKEVYVHGSPHETYYCLSSDDESQQYGLFAKLDKHPGFKLLEYSRVYGDTDNDNYDAYEGFFFNSVSYSVAQGDQIRIVSKTGGPDTMFHVTTSDEGGEIKKVLISASEMFTDEVRDTLWGNNLHDRMFLIYYNSNKDPDYVARVRCEIPTGKTLWGRYEGEFTEEEVDGVVIYTCEKPKYGEEIEMIDSEKPK